MYQGFSKILFNIEESPNYFRMRLDCHEIASTAVPGQFLMARVSHQSDPFLRRPFTIHKIPRKNIKKNGTEKSPFVEILYKVVGKGTKVMCQMREGDEMDLMGPVGRGYRIDCNMTTAILIGGGIGVAPLLYLAEEIVTQCPKMRSIVLFLGGQGKEDVLCVEDFESLKVDVRVATEDGSLGYHGMVVDLLSDYLESVEDDPVCSTHCFACGPDMMLKEISKIAGQKKLPCQISLESRMACGVGACLACGLEIKPQIQAHKKESLQNAEKRQETTDYKRVCKDGPVFDSHEVVWD